jgi:hypothetical protein
MGSVILEVQAREQSTMWQRNIRVRVDEIMRRIRMIGKGMVEFDRMRVNERGREEEDKLPGENPYDMQDQAEWD